MVNLKKIGLKESVLLLALLFCVSFAGRAEAIDLALPMSIHDILQPEQIEGVRTSNALKAIQQGGVRNAMKNQVGSNVSVMQKMMAMRLSRIMSSKPSAQVEEKTTLTSIELNSSESTARSAPASDDAKKDE